jgi:colanic acid/amylovoran biosynthesis glycosyltransferase
VDLVKIACFIPSFPETSQNFILGQLTGLIDQGCELDIFAHSRGNPADAHPDVERYGLLERTQYWAPTRSRLRRAARCLRWVARDSWRESPPLLRTLDPRWGRSAIGLALLCTETPQLYRGDYDIIHSHFGNGAVLPALLRDCLPIRAKLVTTFYGHDVSRYPKLQGRECYADLFERGDWFLALSMSMRERLIELGCPEQKLSVHHLAVNCDQIEYRPRTIEPGETVRLVCAARLVEKKGLRYAIRAVAQLRERKLDAELHILGEGPERPRLEQLVRELELADRVTMRGQVSPTEVIRQIERCHIFVQPSVTARDGDEEGTPTAILEAMASGMPVVATRHSGISEQIEDRVSGFLVPERDSNCLAERLSELVRRPGLWPELGRLGRRRVEAEFDASKQNRTLLDLYHRLLHREATSADR